MWFDLREFYFQIRALVKICLFRPNSWREIAIAGIALVFLPLVVFVCLLANAKYSFPATRASMECQKGRIP